LEQAATMLEVEVGQVTM